MHTIITPLPSSRRKTGPGSTTVEFRQPAYDCQEHADGMKLVVYVPGVGASGGEIEARGPDLTVTARKQHFVRVNFAALHLEGVQRDYQLRLRLGTGFDYAAMEAEIREGVLTITLPKRASGSAQARRVA